MTAHVAPEINDVVETEHTRVACNGDGGALGHPTIYLTFTDENHEVVCPYCSRTYKLKEGTDLHGAH